MTSSETPRPTINLSGKIALLLATAFALMSTAIPSPALPQMAAELGPLVQEEALSRFFFWLASLISDDPSPRFVIKFFVLSVAALFIAIGAPITGWLCDRVGRRSVLIFSLVIFGLSGTWGYFIDSLTPLLISRMILGLAVSGIKASTVAMVGDYFTGDARNNFIGLQGSAMKWGGVIFLFAGSALVANDWRPPFLVYLLAFAVLPFVIFNLAESLPKHLRSAAKSTEPAEPVPYGAVIYVLLAATLANATFFLAPTQIPFFVQDVFPDVPAPWGGYAVGVTNTLAAISAITYGYFKARLNYVAITGYIFLMSGLGFGLVGFADTYSIVIIGMIVAGFGFGMVVPNQSAWILSLVTAKRRGYAVGLVTTAMYIGQTIAPIIVEPLKDVDNPHQFFKSISLILLGLSAAYFIIGFIRRGATAPQSAK